MAEPTALPAVPVVVTGTAIVWMLLGGLAYVASRHKKQGASPHASAA